MMLKIPTSKELVSIQFTSSINSIYEHDLWKVGLLCVKLYLFFTPSNKSFKVKLIFKYF